MKILHSKPDDKILTGIYHYTDEGECSWYDFAVAIVSLEGTNCRIVPVETRDRPTPAKRPPYSVLNKAKIKEDFGIEIPHWRESLMKMMKSVQKKRSR